jgi:hypothetical protein
MAVAAATQEAIWLQRLMVEFMEKQEAPLVIYQDNQGTIAMAKNPVQHARTKHIDIRHHYVREQVHQGAVELKYLPTKEMIADVLTKALPKPQFNILSKEIGMIALDQEHRPWGCVGRETRLKMRSGRGKGLVNGLRNELRD